MDITKVRVLGKRALVKVIPKAEKKTASGIIIPENTGLTESNHGIVLKLGSENRDLQEGNEILWEPFCITTLGKIDGTHFALVDYDKIQVVLT